MNFFCLLTALVIFCISFPACQRQDQTALPERRASASTNSHRDDEKIAQAFRTQTSGVTVESIGTVDKILADDNKGSRHQRFIVRLSTGQTLLIAHNIDVAARVPNLKVGDTVVFHGQYEWNPEGGAVHWTHHDPHGSHPGGFIEHQGRRYQ